MQEEIQIPLPLPLPLEPSAKQIWRKKRLSEQVKNYYLTVNSLIMTKRAKGILPQATITGDVKVAIKVLPGKRNKRDLDNNVKSLLDAFTKVKVWLDDSQVKEMSCKFGDTLVKGMVHIKTMGIRKEGKSMENIADFVGGYRV